MSDESLHVSLSFLTSHVCLVVHPSLELLQKTVFLFSQTFLCKAMLLACQYVFRNGCTGNGYYALYFGRCKDQSLEKLMSIYCPHKRQNICAKYIMLYHGLNRTD